MEHDIDWANKMSEIIAREEFEKNLTQLSINGVPKEDINNMRLKFNNQFKSDKKKSKDDKVSLLKLKDMGMYFGKKSSTRVVNR